MVRWESGCFLPSMKEDFDDSDEKKQGTTPIMKVDSWCFISTCCVNGAAEFHVFRFQPLSNELLNETQQQLRVPSCFGL